MGKATRFAILGLKLVLLAGAAASGHAAERKPLPASDITIPPEFGYVIETHPAADPSRPLIIHIQEAHTNYEAQKHIADILDRLVQQHGLKLILVEGGEGDVGLAYLRGYGPLENRKQVAEKYLRLGIVSAEEYLDIVSDYPLILWGVEQQDLHARNVEAFLQVEQLRASLQPVLAEVRRTIETLTPTLADPAVVELGTARNAFDEERLSLPDYTDQLVRLARQQRLSFTEYPQVERFLDLRELEPTIRVDAVQQEQQALFQQLQQQVSTEVLKELSAQAEGVTAGTVTRQQFYLHLEETAEAADVHLITHYPKLAKYVRYLRESAQLKPAALAEELDRLAARLRQALASTPERQQLQMVSEQLDLVEKLLGLRLSPEEHRRLSAADLAGLEARWLAFLNEQSGAHALPRPSVTSAQLTELEAALPALQRFYDVAHSRDEALIKNTVSKLQDTQELLAVLITGGFHSPQITRGLAEQGIGVVVVTPKISQDTNERLYQAVLKYKSGQGSFEDVEAAAAPTFSAAIGQTGQGGVRQ